ncbi:MAG TPA: formylglycine-generating enzyme family protein [Candidatus Tectomicrobia bacterium]
MLLGIFWKRFGTPTADAGSGTEHEFLRACAAWQQHGRPQIMVYFNRRDPKLRDTAALAQYAVEIPTGPFLMGSSDEADPLWLKASPQRKVTLPSYYMARYPVSVAQFRAFVEASDHLPAHKDSLKGLSNHPVVWVSWHDAIAYCRWLTDRLRAWLETPHLLADLLRTKDWRVTLPSEAEWEKAARGIDGRAYPWGDEPDPDCANSNATGIHTTSAVGCFPHGVSPYGVEELSGNVWEWTRSLEGSYPYPVRQAARAKREDLQASEDASRDLRGGAFWDDHQLVRCAYRNRNVARLVNLDVGFRVALAGPP